MSSLALGLSPAITASLDEITRTRLHGQSIAQRARCVLLAQHQRKFLDISAVVGLSARAVGRWIKRFGDSVEALRHAEKTLCKAAFTRQVLDCFRDAPRSGRPKKFAPDASRFRDFNCV